MPTKRPKEGEDALIHNDDFDYIPEYFELDNTEKLKELNLACMPDNFGYSKEEGEKFFPHYGYPKCSEVTHQNDTYIHIDRDKNILYMDCPDGNKGRYLTGPVDNRKVVYSEEIIDKWNLKKYNGPADASNVEFALGSCSEEEETFMQGTMVPIFKESVYKEAIKHVTDKPKIIYFLTLDSMSRRHTFRKTPQIIDYLNSLNFDPESNYSVFDFKLHNILGSNSIANQIPIFGGKNKFVKSFPGDQNIDYIGNTSL